MVVQVQKWSDDLGHSRNSHLTLEHDNTAYALINPVVSAKGISWLVSFEYNFPLLGKIKHAESIIGGWTIVTLLPA